MHNHYETGYEGRYTNKMGKVKEGEATFWRTSRFRQVAVHDVMLREVLRGVGVGGVGSVWKSETRM